jgi:isoquinoline 1-oxidoreductase beta subunit
MSFDNETVSRRSFIKTSSITSAGLVIGFNLPSWANAADGGASTGVMNAWLKISRDNQFTFVLDRTEMGQGVADTLPVLLAEELDVDPYRLILEHAPRGKEYFNPEMGIQITGGSSSARLAYSSLRMAGGTARAMLITGVAKHWGVAISACRTDDGKIFGPDGRTMTYGEAVPYAVEVREKDVTLKTADAFKRIGRPSQRLDSAQKVSGECVFGIDVHIDGCLSAVVIRPPRLGAQVRSFDASQARSAKGFVNCFPIARGIAVVAEKFWQAKSIAALVTVQWDESKSPNIDSTALFANYKAKFNESGGKIASEGDAEGVLKTAAAKKVEAIYEIPYAAHAPMEPQNCVAHVRENSCDVWAPTQSPSLATAVAAQVTGLAPKDIHIHPTFIGGGFGRRITQEYVEEAVAISKELGKPVQVIWTREDDMKHSPYRPMAVHQLAGVVDGTGKLSGWKHKLVTQSLLSQFVPTAVPAILPDWAPQWFKGAAASAASGLIDWLGKDAIASEGASKNPYAIANYRVDHVVDEPGVPISFWRSVGHSGNAFVVESFLDELAHSAKIDPIEFRLKHLPADSEYRRVLSLAAEKSGWPNPLAGSDRFRGVAVHASFGSCVAQVCEVTKTATGVRIDRIVCAIDCGMALNPDVVKAQMEGGIVFSLSQALGGAITFEKGAVVQSNFHDYPIMRMADVPVIDVFIVQSNKGPQGVGEPAVPPLPAALGNAIFAATGVRHRKMPFTLNI